MYVKSFAVHLFVFLFLTASAAGQVITGKVVDARTKEALPGATITLVNTPLGVLSDPTGRFEIKTKGAGAQVVRITRVGYEPFEDLLTPGPNLLDCPRLASMMPRLCPYSTVLPPPLP